MLPLKSICRLAASPLLVAPVRVLNLAEIFSELVENDQGGIVAEQFPDRVRSWRDFFLVGLAEDFVASFACQLIGDFAPWRKRTDNRGSGPTISESLDLSRNS